MTKNFRKTTNDIMGKATIAEIAVELGCSTNTVLQARLPDKAKAHRNPPAAWEGKLLKLAEKRIAYFQKIADNLRGQIERAQ